MSVLRSLVVFVFLMAVGQFNHFEHVALATVSPPAQPATLQEKVAALEYQPSIQQGQLSAPNRAQGLRLRWAIDGVEVETRESHERLVKLQTIAFGHGDNLQTCDDAPATQEEGRVVRKWEGFTEWWVNGIQGVEEGWTVAQRPPGDGPTVGLRRHQSC